jgi:UDP:flavonoid glycosyltransferase YjiC (YdhE family)
MRLAIVTFGSEGDTRPLAALCRSLLDNGHEVRLFAEQSTLGLPRALGIPCEALAGDVKAALPIADPRLEMRPTEVMKSVNALNAVVAANTASWLRTAASYARGAEAILFSSLAANAGNALAKELRKPGIGLFFQPITPTSEFSSPLLPPMTLPGGANRLTFVLANWQTWKVCAKAARAARLEVFGSRTSERLQLDHPMLYGISRELVPRPSDWPETHLICGHWARGSDGWQAPNDLLDFLANSEPPIYAGFGSPSGFVRAKALNALVNAVAGRRAVFSPGWSRIDSAVLPRNFFVAPHVPHEWLFPRVGVVIHHGGAGTTHTAARAGVPQVILPIGGDHHFWAHRVAMRGAAPKYSRGARFDAKAIASMLEFAQREDTRRCARVLGEAMSQEDGVGFAIREIQGVVASTRRI